MRPARPVDGARRSLLRRGVLAAGAALGLPLGALGGCAAPPAGSPGPAGGFAAWSEALAAEWVRLSPEWASSTQYFGGAEQARLDAELTPLGEARHRERMALARRGLAGLAGFEAQPLGADERVGAGILRWSLQQALDDAPFEGHQIVFSQLWGPQVRYLNLLAEQQPLRRGADLDAWLSRLAQVPQRLDEAIARDRRAAARGLLPPRFIVERAQAQVAAVLAQGEAPEGVEVLKALARGFDRIAGLPEARAQAAMAEATARWREAVRPAYLRVQAHLAELHPRTTADAGLWRLPRGDEAYAQALRRFTTTALGADEIHAIGLAEVARLEAEMDGLLDRIAATRGAGFVRANRAERLSMLNRALQPPGSSDPREAMLARYTEAVRDAERRAEPLFRQRPRAPVVVRRVPALTERTASAYYTAPTPDGSQPGIFWVPLPGPTYGVLSLRSLAVHEAVPGHHFQLALQLEQAALPRWRQRRIFGGGSAHAEGWALYAERLALEQGWYDEDLPSKVGALSAQLFRARRLVVDTGLHARRWTREQAIAYGISASEVERYVANPGQACAYYVGMLRILALREGAQRRLGPAFSLPGFHDVVLRAGSVPLPVLDEVVAGWTGDPVNKG